LKGLRFLASIVIAASLGGGALAQTDGAANVGDGYDAGDFGRVRTLDPAATLIRSDAGEQAGETLQADINSPIFAGDTLFTKPGDRAEVQLASGTLVRLDADTAVTFAALPDPYANIADNAILKLSRGSVRIVGRAPSDSDFRIDAPAASAFLMGDVDVRVDVLDGGAVRVVSRRGVAEVVGAGSSVIVRGGTRTRVEVDSVPDAPQAFNTFSEDSFDGWCAALDEGRRGRVDHAATADVPVDTVPSEVRPYYGELSGYGRWVDLPTYGAAWVPYGSSFQPYVNGYWAYSPRGYFWVSYEPWGWAPYHYGRWTWAVGYGWSWIPGSMFGGAWVSWSWGPRYVGWCPLNYWNQPCYTGGSYRYGHYDPHCWTFVNTAHVGYHGGHHGHAVPYRNVATSVSNNAIVTRPPRIAPSALSQSEGTRQRAFRDAAADRTAQVRRDESVSGNRGPSFRQSESARTRPGRIARPASEETGLARRTSEPPSSGAPTTMRPARPRGGANPPAEQPRSGNPELRRRAVDRNLLREPRVERKELPHAAEKPNAVPERGSTNRVIPRSGEGAEGRSPDPTGRRERVVVPRREIAPQDTTRVRREASADAIREMYRRAAGARAARPQGGDAPAARRRAEGTEPRPTVPQRESAAPSPDPRAKDRGPSQERQGSSGHRGSSGRKTGKRR